MQRALLLFNPAAGARREQRQRTIDAVAEALRGRGVQVTSEATTGPGEAGRQAARAEVDAVFACGGDGTIHDVVQGLVRTAPESQGHGPALGVIPLGTANALARDLGLPLDPVAAALRQLEYVPTRVPAGQIRWVDPAGTHRSRYFAVMAGAGAHGALMYSMLGGSDSPDGGSPRTLTLPDKNQFGRTAYYVRSLVLFLRQLVPFGPRIRRFPRFLVEFAEADSTEIRRLEAVSAIAVRVSSLGGLFHPLVIGGSIASPTMRLVIVRPPGNLSLPLWFGMSWLGAARWNRFACSYDVTSFRCAARPVQAPDLQADGEWLDRAEAEFTMIPNALRLLMPNSTSEVQTMA